MTLDIKDFVVFGSLFLIIIYLLFGQQETVNSCSNKTKSGRTNYKVSNSETNKILTADANGNLSTFEVTDNFTANRIVASDNISGKSLNITDNVSAKSLNITDNISGGTVTASNNICVNSGSCLSSSDINTLKYLISNNSRLTSLINNGVLYGEGINVMQSGANTMLSVPNNGVSYTYLIGTRTEGPYEKLYLRKR